MTWLMRAEDNPVEPFLRGYLCKIRTKSQQLRLGDAVERTVAKYWKDMFVQRRTQSNLV